MSKVERVIKIIHLLQDRGSVGKQEMLDKFEVAEPTFKRDIAFLRDQYGADIQYDRHEEGLPPGGRGLCPCQGRRGSAGAARALV